MSCTWPSLTEFIICPAPIASPSGLWDFDLAPGAPRPWPPSSLSLKLSTTYWSRGSSLLQRINPVVIAAAKAAAKMPDLGKLSFHWNTSIFCNMEHMVMPGESCANLQCYSSLTFAMTREMQNAWRVATRIHYDSTFELDIQSKDTGECYGIFSRVEYY